MADRVKMVIAQIRHFPQYFSVFFIKRKQDLFVFSFDKKHQKMLGKLLNLRHHPPVYPTEIYHWINSKLKRDGKNPQGYVNA
jgi:hypothetical protein